MPRGPSGPRHGLGQKIAQHPRQPPHRRADSVLPGVTLSLTLKRRSPGRCRDSLLIWASGSVTLTSSAQAETGESEAEQRERAGFGDGNARKCQTRLTSCRTGEIRPIG